VTVTANKSQHRYKDVPYDMMHSLHEIAVVCSYMDKYQLHSVFPTIITSYGLRQHYGSFRFSQTTGFSPHLQANEPSLISLTK
jgi:hypothetical protein